MSSSRLLLPAHSIIAVCLIVLAQGVGSTSCQSPQQGTARSSQPAQTAPEPSIAQVAPTVVPTASATSRPPATRAPSDTATTQATPTPIFDTMLIARRVFINARRLGIQDPLVSASGRSADGTGRMIDITFRTKLEKPSTEVETNTGALPQELSDIFNIVVEADQALRAELEVISLTVLAVDKRKRTQMLISVDKVKEWQAQRLSGEEFFGTWKVKRFD